MKYLFKPFSIAAGLLAAKVAQKVFDAIWSIFDDEEAPEAGQRDVPIVKLVLALVIEGAIFRTVRGLIDRSARRGFYSLTGSWPGEEAPEQA